MNVNGGVDMPMIGTSDRAGQVRTGYQSLFHSGTVLTTAGSQRGDSVNVGVGCPGALWTKLKLHGCFAESKFAKERINDTFKSDRFALKQTKEFAGKLSGSRLDLEVK